MDYKYDAYDEMIRRAHHRAKLAQDIRHFRTVVRALDRDQAPAELTCNRAVRAVFAKRLDQQADRLHSSRWVARELAALQDGLVQGALISTHNLPCGLQDMYADRHNAGCQWAACLLEVWRIARQDELERKDR